MRLSVQICMMCRGLNCTRKRDRVISRREGKADRLQDEEGHFGIPTPDTPRPTRRTSELSVSGREACNECKAKEDGATVCVLDFQYGMLVYLLVAR
jgi:hypothetical protein